MASLILNLKNRSVVYGVRCVVNHGGLFQQSFRGRHAFIYKTDIPVSNRILLNRTASSLKISQLGILRLASTNVNQTNVGSNTDGIVGSNASNNIANNPELKITETANATTTEITFDDSLLPPIPTPPGGENVSQVVASTEVSLPDIDAETLLTVAEPSLQSLGLCHWTPPGLLQMFLEYLHIGWGMPWWAAIATTTFCLRTFVLPFAIKSRKNMILMQNHMPEIQAIQLKMSDARNHGNNYEAARYSYELYNFFKEKKITGIAMFLPLMVQAPIFLSMFWGLRKMTEVPVESLKTGGLFWFVDLTLPDQYYLLPLITSASVWVMLELGTDSTKVSHMQSVFMKVFLRCIPVIMLPFTIKFQASILTYWCATNFYSMFQIAILKLPSVQKFFGLPKAIEHKKEDLPNTNKPFFKGMKDAYSNMKIAREIGDRERLNAVTFEEAGRMPIRRTFKKDPTKLVNTVVNQQLRNKGSNSNG